MEESIDWENWSVQEWLKSIGQSKYVDGFIDNGYDTPDLVAELGKEDLDAIGVTKKKDRSTLFTQAMKLKELVSKDMCNCSNEPPPLLFPGASTGGSTSPLSSQPPTDSYSEPWSSYTEPWGPSVQNGTGSGGSNGITPQMIDMQRKHATRNAGGGHVPPIKLTKGKHAKPPPSPKTPNIAELPAFKREGVDTGLTTLQLKLKIREELKKDLIILSEHPYNAANEGEHEQLLIDLAEDYSKRFRAESLGVYDALLDVWRQANYATEFAVPVTIKQATSGGKDDVDHTTKGGDPTDNYDEPFDSQLGVMGNQGVMAVKQNSREGSPKKSRTLPTGGSGSGFQSYDEPFDSVVTSESSPKNLVKKNSSHTLPSPQIQRQAEENRVQVESKKKKNKKLSTEKSPHASPVSSPKSSPKPQHRGFTGRLFKKKEKARSNSVREFDTGKTDKKKKAFISFPEHSKDNSWGKKKHGSAENLATDRDGSSSLDTKHNRKSVGALLYNGDASPPPLPPPRRVPKSTSPTSSESEDSPFHKKKYNGKEFKKFITPPTLKRNEKLERGYSTSSSEGDGNASAKMQRVLSHPSTTGSDVENDNEDGKQWLKTSRSFDQLNVIQNKSSRKSKKGGLLKRIFKRKSDTPSSKKREKKANQNRESLLSTSSTQSGSGDALTASISMPDIASLTVPSSSLRPPTSLPRHIPCSPIKPSDLDLSDEHDTSRSQGPVRLSTSSPKKSSPRELSPLMHRRMFVRGSTDSSSTNPASIPGGSAPSSVGGGNFIENAVNSNSSSQRSHTPDLDSLKFSDSEDVEMNKPHSRSNTGSGPKPPPPPKPQKPSPKSTPISTPQHKMGETTPISTSAPPTSTPLSNKPPPKPQRTRSQKKLSVTAAVKEDSVAGGGSGSPQETVLKSEEGLSQPTPPKPAKRKGSVRSSTPEENQSVSSKPLPPVPARRVSSNQSLTPDDEPSTPERQPVSPTTDDSNKRPPKPARRSLTTPPLPDDDDDSKSTGDTVVKPPPKPVRRSLTSSSLPEDNEQVDDKSTATDSVNNKPPPKPARKYKSLKILDSKEDSGFAVNVTAKSKTLDGRTMKSLADHASGEGILTSPCVGESNDTKPPLKPKPRPAPKPRGIVPSKTDSTTVAPPGKPPRASIKRNKPES